MSVSYSNEVEMVVEIDTMAIQAFVSLIMLWPASFRSCVTLTIDGDRGASLFL